MRQVILKWGVHDDSTSQMNLQSEKVLEEEQTSLADSSKIAVLTNSSVTTISYQEADDLSEIDQKQSHFLVPLSRSYGWSQGRSPSLYYGSTSYPRKWLGSSELAKAPNNNLLALRIQRTGMEKA